MRFLCEWFTTPKRPACAEEERRNHTAHIVQFMDLFKVIQQWKPIGTPDDDRKMKETNKSFVDYNFCRDQDFFHKFRIFRNIIFI